MDAGLLRAFRKGDPDALEAVYRQHVGEVESWLRRALLRVGRLTPADLGDLVQDVFLRAFSDAARASYDGLREYPPFLMTIARNLFVDWARRAGREIPGSDFLDDALEIAGGEEHPAEVVLDSSVFGIQLHGTRECGLRFRGVLLLGENLSEHVVRLRQLGIVSDGLLERLQRLRHSSRDSEGSSQLRAADGVLWINPQHCLRPGDRIGQRQVLRDVAL